MKILAILFVCLALYGCGSLNKKPDAIITEKVVNIDPRLLLPCEDLKSLPKDKADFSSIIETTVLNAQTYFDCRSKQNDSIKILKEFANKKETP